MTALGLAGRWVSCSFCSGGDTDLWGLATQTRGDAQRVAQPGLRMGRVSGQKVKSAPVLLPSVESRMSREENDAVLSVTGTKSFKLQLASSQKDDFCLCNPENLLREEKFVLFISAHLGSKTQRCHIKIRAVNYVILGITVDRLERWDDIRLPQSLPQLLPGALTLQFCYPNPRCAGNVGTARGRWSEMPAPAWGLLTLTSLPPSSHCLISTGEPRRFAAGSWLMQST